MVTSDKGIELIKKFEGIELVAYKAVPTEKYYTIGYGHYGSDVLAGQAITVEQATELLRKDLKKSERAVNKYVSIYNLNQNQFDALVSFTFNCGVGNLDSLTKNGTRTLGVIKEKLLLYNKAGGKELLGLTRRRKAELDLFNTPVTNTSRDFKVGVYKITASALRVRSGAGTNYKMSGSSIPRNKEVAVTEIIYTNNDVWGKVSNGYIAIQLNNNTYAEYIRNIVVYSNVVEYSRTKHGNNSISKNFKIKEFASKDGADKILIDLVLVEQLQRIRDHFNSPVNINSGYRSASHNKNVGGVKNSYHTQGRACDIRVSGVTPVEVARYAESIGVHGIGLYDNFVHVDTRDSKYFYRYKNGNYIKQSTFK